jgi:hypothetical protein
MCAVTPSVNWLTLGGGAAGAKKVRGRRTQPFPAARAMRIPGAEQALQEIDWNLVNEAFSCSKRDLI